MRSLFQKIFLRKPVKRSRKEGQTLVEYALILALLTVVMILSISMLGKQVVKVFSAITSLLDTVQASH